MPMKKPWIKAINRLDTELLIAHVIGKSREYVLAHPNVMANVRQRLHFKRLARKRARGVPLAYLTGHKEFFGLNFLVNKHVLIPRPETELVVELALNQILNHKSKILNQLLLIDVGTGSGCIPIAIMKALKPKNIKIMATDISRPALRVAKKNAKRHNVDIQFFHGNLLEPFTKKYQLPATCYQLVITANLPYLTQSQFDSEPSIQHEPRFALVADNGGLALYEQLLAQIKQLLTAYRCQLTALFEINPSQSASITALVKRQIPSASVEITKDLAGRDRVAQITAPV